MATSAPDRWPHFDESTAGFLRLYQEVSRLLRIAKPTYELEEQEWLEYLIVGFEREYREWESAAILRKFLDRVHKGSRGRSTLRIIGYAYLHICYDLPRVLADSFLVFPQIDADRAHWIFQQLAPTFTDAFLNLLEESKGTFGMEGRLASTFVPLLGKKRVVSLAKFATSFVISLRNGAWYDAQLLTRAGGRRRSLEIDVILKAIETNSKPVMREQHLVEWLTLPVVLISVPPGGLLKPEKRVGTKEPGQQGESFLE